MKKNSIYDNTGRNMSYMTSPTTETGLRGFDKTIVPDSLSNIIKNKSFTINKSSRDQNNNEHKNASWRTDRF